MRSASWLLLLLGLLGPSTGFSQASDGAGWLRERLETELAARGAPTRESGDYGFKFVFLFDSSQAGWKSAYRAFVQTTIESFLNKQLEAPGSRATSIAVYAYQASLYDRPGQFLELSPLTKEIVGRIGEVLPNDRLTTGPNGEPLSSRGGHDHSGARKKLLDSLAASSPSGPDQKVPTIVVQFTTTPFNELPGDQAADLRVRGLNARTSLLDGTGFVPYEVPGLPLNTEVPQGFSAPFPVYIWIYGPQRFSKLKPVVQDKSSTTTSSGESKGGTTRIFPAPLLALILLALIGLAFFYIVKPVRITIYRGNAEVHTVTVRRNAEISIYGSGATKTRPNALILTDTDAPGAPPERLATLKIPWIGSAYVEGSHWVLDAPGAKGGRLTLDRKRSFRLKSKTDALSTVGFSAKVA